jgi:tRNA (guanine26-N2/guanine27-N2)-dimethyltransferase
MYGGPLHNPAFIERILRYLPNLDKETYPTIDRIEGMLMTALEETDFYVEENSKSKKSMLDKSEIERVDPSMIDHHPFYFIPSSLARVLHCAAPRDTQIKGALRHAGYRATRSHAKPGTIKTDAPWSFLWKVMVEWVRQYSPIHEGSLKEGMAGWQMLTKMGFMSKATETENDPMKPQKGCNGEGKESSYDAGKDETKHLVQNEIVFDEELGKDRQSRRLVRYQVNPRANWGPMNRAK